MKNFTRLFSYAILPLSISTVSFSYNQSPLIVGGEDAKSNEFPFMASLQKDGRHYCAGSLIGEQTILTAAHCVIGQKAENLKISLGRHNLNIAEDETAQTYQVKDITIHPDYSGTTFVNDVAIIHLEEAAELNDFVQPIPLAEKDSTPEGTTTIIGWGRLEGGFFGGLPDVLQIANVDVVSNENCNEAYSKRDLEVKEGMMCAASPNTDSCQGDSGGPLFQDGKLLGITSWGIGCASPDFPGVYTQVSSFLDFITENI